MFCHNSKQTNIFLPWTWQKIWILVTFKAVLASQRWSIVDLWSSETNLFYERKTYSFKKSWHWLCPHSAFLKKWSKNHSFKPFWINRWRPGVSCQEFLNFATRWRKLIILLFGWGWGTKVYVQNWLEHRFCLTALTSQNYSPSSGVCVPKPIRAIWWYLPSI